MYPTLQPDPASLTDPLTTCKGEDVVDTTDPAGTGNASGDPAASHLRQMSKT